MPCRDLTLLHFDDELRQIALGGPFPAVDSQRQAPMPTSLLASEHTNSSHVIPTLFGLAPHGLSLADSLPKVSQQASNHGAL